MKTLVLFESIPEQSWFTVIEDNLARFHNVYVNDAKTCRTLQNALTDYMFDDKGEFKFTKSDYPSRDWDIFIKCGFIL